MNPTWNDLITYRFNQDSIVFDVGGYKGDFTNLIYEKYKCKVFVFEPVKEFYEIIKNRFLNNENIETFNFGISNITSDEKIFLSNDSSSIFCSKSSGKNEIIKLVDIIEFINQENINKVDLIKINIEGAEYDLMEHLLINDKINIFNNLLIQFHRIIPNADYRREKIRENLKRTHELTCDFDFVFENWLKKEIK